MLIRLPSYSKPLLPSRKNCFAGLAKFPKLNVNLSVLLVPFLSVLAVVSGANIDSEFINAQSDATLGIAATGDISCKPQGEQTINKIEEYQMNGTVDKVLWLGDLSYNETADCFFNESNQLPVKDTLAVIGNHDDAEDGEGNNQQDRELRKQILEKYGLPSVGYYSRTWNVTDSNNSSNSILVVGMDTQSDFEKDSVQYDFIEDTLRDNSELEKPASLVIVMMHKPVVSCTCKHPHDGEELPEAETYHPLFKKYGVDVVLQGHNHNVQYYNPVDGVLYILSGEGGKGHHGLGDDFPRNFPDNAGEISIDYKKAETYGFTLLEADFDTFELKGSLISNLGTPESSSNFTMQFED